MNCCLFVCLGCVLEYAPSLIPTECLIYTRPKWCLGDQPSVQQAYIFFKKNSMKGEYNSRVNILKFFYSLLPRKNKEVFLPIFFLKSAQKSCEKAGMYARALMINLYWIV